jgi:hypothetical protein
LAGERPVSCVTDRFQKGFQQDLCGDRIDLPLAASFHRRFTPGGFSTPRFPFGSVVPFGTP